MHDRIARASRRAKRGLVAVTAAAALALATLGAAPGGGAPADQADQAERNGRTERGGLRSGYAYDLAGELMSPFCPGRTLASCPSPQAGELIQWIATQEAAGVTRDEVVRMLIDRYGEDILGAPPAKGITLWAWVLPVIGFFAIGTFALLVLRRIVAPGVRPGTAASAGPGGTTADASPPSAASRGAAEAGVSTRVGPPEAASDELARIVDAELEKRA
ncbi:MAG: cytochrome c-type biogenesis protein CcmH [Myxococcota bacterium]